MKLQNLSIIFLIIIIPIILILSYYIQLQIDTITMQTNYNAKLIDSTREAIDAFEINTVQWNTKYSGNSDSKRRDIQASINTFVSSLSNNLGISGTSKNSVLHYVPALAYTLYDGYYIYSATNIADVATTAEGVADLTEIGGTRTVQYKNTTTNTNTTIREDATTTYQNVLKPFVPYSELIKNTNLTVNYTLDNYISIYGTAPGISEYVNKSGYLVWFNTTVGDPDRTIINPGNLITATGIGIKYNGTDITTEDLSEQVIYKNDNDPTTTYNNRSSIPIYI